MKTTGFNRVILTIFTPTYNRADLLPCLYKSIVQQVGLKDSVEWLIVDDGSTDNTSEVIEGFVEQRPDLVRAIHVDNGGKHRAINCAAREAAGEWIMIVDSDDRVMDGAIREILEQVEVVRDRAEIGVIRGLRFFPELNLKQIFAIPSNPCRHVDWVSKQKSFDTAEVIRAEVLKNYPFPEHPGERFMAEGWLWYTMDKTHLTYFVSHPWVECRYQPHGLSASSRKIRAHSPNSAMDVYAAMLQSPIPWRLHLRVSINWWRYRFHANRKQEPLKLVWPIFIGAPLGWILFKTDKALAERQ